MQNKKILELCLSQDLGGLELYMVRASQFLHKKTDVISVINVNGKLEQYYKNSSYRYEKIKRSSTISSFLSAKRLARIIDKNKIDIVHLHWTKDISVAVLAKKLSTCKPKLVQTRNMTMTRFKDDFYHRWLYKNMDMMLAVTHQVKEQIERFVPQDICPKVEVLYMGADMPELATDEEKETLKKQYGLSDAFTVGIVGRIEEGKGQYLVIDAVKKLLGEGLHVQALIVGHAMNERYLESLKDGIKKDHLEDKIIFSGFTREAQKLMQIFDCLVLATDRETFGLVLIEAMACEICTIGTNNAGPLEIIDEAKNGLLFEQGNSGDLAKKIELLAKDESLKHNLAQAGKLKAKEMFDSEKQFEKLYTILENLNYIRA